MIRWVVIVPAFCVNRFPDQCDSWPMIIKNSGRLYSTVFPARVSIAHDIQVKRFMIQ